MIYIILPNYAQSSKIFVLAFNANTQHWEAKNYGETISTLRLPKSWARGLPAPIQNRHPESDFVLGQIATSGNNKRYQSWACCAGKDITGRDVFLTLIAESSVEVQSIFGLNNTKNFDGVVSAAEAAKIKSDGSTEHYLINDIQKSSLIKALQTITGSHTRGGSIQDMISRANDGRYKHYVSTSFKGMSNLPDSEQEDGGDRSPLRKEVIVGTVAVVIFVIFALVYFSYSRKTENRKNEECKNPSILHSGKNDKDGKCKIITSLQ